MVDSDEHWIRLGKMDPYLQTVETLDPYKLDPAVQRHTGTDAYFLSGDRYVAALFDVIERHVASGFRPRLAVDFGCSVGRIALPLARRAENVIGVDVSTDALSEARQNAARRNVTNVRWVPSDDALSRVEAPVDLFHTYNVLQHLDVTRGLIILRRALERLAPGGILAAHVPYADTASPVRRAINWAQARLPGIHALANIARGRPRDYPHMLMNAYDLNAVMSLLHQHGVSSAHLEHVEQRRYPGVIIFARKP